MKRILFYSATLLTMVACGRGNDFDATGTFEATEVVVSAEAAGRILSFDAEEGDAVQAGRQIGAIDTVQLYLQKLQLERQRASVISNRPDIRKQAAALREQIAKQEIERSRVVNLLKDGAATTKQLDDIDASLKVLNGQLEALLSTLGNNTAAIDENSSALELQIAQIEDRLMKSRIASPISGTVLAKYSEQGELAAVGRPLMKVADMENVYLRAYFTSDQLSSLKIGQEVTVTADFGGDEQIDYPGRITWIASESEFTPKNIQTKSSRASLVYAVKIAVKNDGRLKLGLYGEVKLRKS
ncbi:MAG: HlyD family efflux transporter periplasmic adaptor subunit [Alistipes sp.]|uniref:HlyD family efflux transporter periplasmic adaptor subunit n=1 Tax=Alistipes intestinihominis TaxID=3133172 RepID=A0ABV1H1L0_9BACT|nr:MULTISPECIES: HlyD family efflux transporter periplasmic adaptor subunit [Alistipes]MBR2218547.1 HlyD family efflux transporter periplasmic adaptor subunit [Alistipes sp.]